jgi:hypothetical protein
MNRPFCLQVNGYGAWILILMNWAGILAEQHGSLAVGWSSFLTIITDTIGAMAKSCGGARLRGNLPLGGR